MSSIFSLHSVGEQGKPMLLRASPRCRVRARAASSKAGPQAVEIPHQWYNLIADLPVKPPPALHPQTQEPIKPEDLSPLFPDELIKQEASTDRFIAIPEEVIDVYRLWRPTPLIRFVHNSSFLWEIHLSEYDILCSESNVVQWKTEPRGWRSFLTHLPGFITSMKVLAQLDPTNPTLQSHKSGIMHNKVSRVLLLKPVLANGEVHWPLLAAYLALTVK